MSKPTLLWAVEFNLESDPDAWFVRQPTYEYRSDARRAARDLRKQFPGCGYRVAKYVRCSRSRRSEP